MADYMTHNLALAYNETADSPHTLTRPTKVHVLC